MQTLRSVQRLMEQVPTNPAPTALAQGGAYRSWLDGYRSSNGLSDSLALVDKVRAEMLLSTRFEPSR